MGSKGSRPQVVKQQQFESALIYGAVCPATGKTEAKDVMRKPLQLISNTTEDGRYAVVIADRASWHMGDIASEFRNLSIIPLLSYSPGLNPVEQVWQWMRQRELSNRTFSGYEDIVRQVS